MTNFIELIQHRCLGFFWIITLQFFTAKVYLLSLGWCYMLLSLCHCCVSPGPSYRYSGQCVCCRPSKSAHWALAWSTQYIHKSIYKTNSKGTHTVAWIATLLHLISLHHTYSFFLLYFVFIFLSLCFYPSITWHCHSEQCFGSTDLPSAKVWIWHCFCTNL